MDGKLLLRELRHILNEESDSDLLDTFTSYNFINDAANEINMRIEHIRNSQTITTVADQIDYTLDAAFMKLYQRDSKDRYFIRYSDGTTYTNIIEKDRNVIIHGNTAVTDTSVDVPDNFYIADDKTLDSQVTGTATSAGALSAAGNATLTDTAADFSDVSAGDNIHNTTDGSMGIVISKTSSTVLVTAMFDGTENDWDTSDAYVIQPQGRYKIVLDPPPNTASESVIVPYVSRLAPVYSDYDHFRLPIQYKEALLSYAAFLYNYRAGKQDVGDKYFVIFDNEVRRNAYNSNKSLGRNRVIVNFKKR